MDVAATAKRAARTAVADVEPVGLREQIDDGLAANSALPGVLVLRVGTAGGNAEIDLSADGPLGRRAAGVQLVFRGLEETRRLTAEADWDRDSGARTETELALIAADVSVARGTQLLAETAAIDRAVEVVRAFGRDQTGVGERRLERDVLELAVVAGGTLDRDGVSPRLEELAAELARMLTEETGAFRPVEAVDSGVVAERLAATPRLGIGSTTD